MLEDKSITAATIISTPSIILTTTYPRVRFLLCGFKIGNIKTAIPTTAAPLINSRSIRIIDDSKKKEPITPYAIRINAPTIIAVFLFESIIYLL
jgi:hypothetical protein